MSYSRKCYCRRDEIDCYLVVYSTSVLYYNTVSLLTRFYQIFHEWYKHFTSMYQLVRIEFNVDYFFPNKALFSINKKLHNTFHNRSLVKYSQVYIYTNKTI